MNIIVVEDDPSLNFSISLLLKKASHRVFSYTDAESVIEAPLKEKIDLFILDINLPGEDGFSLLKLLRPYFSYSEFLFISQYSDLGHIKKAFELGCEDYIKKPFEVEELLLRVQKIQQRKEGNTNIELGYGYEFDLKEGVLYSRTKATQLTQIETQLLNVLVLSKNQIVEYARLCDEVWEKEVTHNTIAAVIRRLRKKLHPELIRSVRERGYYLTPEES